MRIISGTYKGYRLHPPSNLPVRPTTDKAKESLFNILKSRYTLETCSVLDLFSGTGNIALEFASNGASKVTAVEQHVQAFRYISQVVKLLNIENASIQKADVFKWLVQPGKEPFDIIFADPPYDHPGMGRLPGLIFENKLLKPTGVCIIEHRNSFKYHNIWHTETRDYGQSCFSFFKWPEANAVSHT